MSWSLLQHPKTNDASSNTSASVAITPNAAGNLLVAIAFVNGSGQTLGTPTGLTGGSWTNVVNHSSTNVGGTTGCWIAAAPSTSAFTIGFSWSANNTADLIVAEFSGLVGTPTLDGTLQTDDAGHNANPITTPTYTPGTVSPLVLDLATDSANTTGVGATAAYSGGPAWSAGDAALAETAATWAYVVGPATALLVTPDVTQGGANTSCSFVFGVEVGVNPAGPLEPASDIATTGWTPSTGTTLWQVLSDNSDSTFCTATI